MTTRSSSTSASASRSRPATAAGGTGTGTGTGGGGGNGGGRLGRFGRRFGRVLGLVLAGGLGLAVLALGGLIAVASTESGRQWLAGWAADALAAATGMGVAIDGLGPGLPADLRLDRLRIADAEGVWLRVDGLHLSWQPSALLRGRLVVARVAADSIEMARPPVTAATAAAPPAAIDLSIPEPPLDLRVERLALPRLVLGPAVLGVPAAFAIEGRLAAPVGDTIVTRIAIDRIDGAAGSGRLALELTPASGRLSLDLRVAEPADGLAVRLLGLDPYPPFTLTLEGDGPIADWRGRLAVAATDRLAVDAELGLRRTAAGLRLAAAGQGRWQGPVPAALAPAIADGVRFQVAALRGDDGAIAVETLGADGRGWTLNGGGRLEADGSGFDAKARLEADPQAVDRAALAGWRFARLTTEATAAGRLDSLPAATLAIAGEATAVAGGEATAGRLHWQGSVGPAAAAGRAVRVAVAGTDVSLADPALAPLLGPAPTLLLEAGVDALGRRLDIASLRLTAAAATAEGGGRLALDAGDSDLRLEIGIADLSRLAPVAGPGWSGQGKAVLRLTGALATGRGQGRLEATAAGLGSADPVVQAALGDRPALVADVTLDPATGFALSGVALTGRALTATGGARLDPGLARLEASLDARVDLAPVAAAAGSSGKGPLALSLTAEGPLADPQATLRLVADGTEIAGQAIGRGRIDVAAATLVSRPAGTLTAALLTADGGGDARLGFRLEAGRTLHVDDLAAALFGLRASGDLAVTLADGTIAGGIDVVLPGDPAGVALAGVRLGGRGNGRIDFRPVGGRQDLTLRFAGEALRLADASAAAAGAAATAPATGDAAAAIAAVRRLDIEADIDDAFATPLIDARLAAEGLMAAGEGPLAVDVAASGGLSGLAFRGRLDGPAERLDRLAVGGRANLAAAPATIVVDRLDGRLGGAPLALARPLQLTAGGGRLAVAGLDLGLGDGRLAGRLDLGPGRTDAALTVDRLPLAVIHAWVPAVPAAGHLDAGVDLATTGGRVEGALTLRSAQLRLASGPVPPPPLDVDVTLAVAATGSALRARLAEAAGGERLDVTARATLPVRLVAGSLAPAIDRGAAIDGEVRIAGDAAFVAETLALPDQRLTGRLAGAVRLAGTLAEPQATGDVGLVDGLYENFVTGTLLRPLDARIGFEAGQGASLTLAAATPGGGRIAVAGGGRLAAAGPALDVRVALADARLVARDDITATAAGTLAYAGGLDRGTLEGRLVVTPVEINLKDRLPPSVVFLPVTEINRPGGDPPPPPSLVDEARPLIALAIALEMPRRIFVRGRGLESEWQGSLAVGGNSETPRLTGDIGLVRGTFSFASKRFTLQRGNIGFFGGPTIDPLLDLAAESRTRELTAVIAVRGPASDPELQITSQPPLPESEVLARVMFGKETTRLSPFEAVQLAAALDALAGGDTWTEDALGSVRQFLGLDVLSVDASGDDKGPALEVGRYLGDRVYVGARRGLTDDTSGGRVEVEIFPGLSLQSDILQDVDGTTGSIGLRWKHDY